MAVAPVDAPYIPAKYQGDKQTPTLSVIHSTVGPTKAGSARAIARYGQNPSSPSSWHYAIDAAEVIQSVHDHTVAYHCGYNQNSLGYEMCDNPSRLTAIRWLGRDHKAMLDRTARAVARNHAAYGIPVRFLTDAQLRAWNANGRKAKDGGIATHDQMSRVFKRSTHWDPGKWPTKKFLALVKKYHAELTAPPPPPVTTHTRWAIRTTGVHDAPGGKKLRDIPAGYKFQVVDGSGHGNDGWIETAAGNWVVGADTTRRDPALPSRLSVSTHNVWNARDWEDDVLPTINAILPKHQIDVPNFQECYRAPDLRGKVPGYTFRNQGYGYEPETPGYIEERSDNVILVRDGVEVKVHGADQMTESWAGPKMGVMHDPRVFRRVTVNKDEQNFRVINVHGPFGPDARQEFLEWAQAEFQRLAALGDPVIFIGDWNVSYETLKAAMGPLATIDGGPPDMVAYANCRKVDSANLGRQGSDTHNFKIWTFEA